jgi:hypothetical protein
MLKGKFIFFEDLFLQIVRNFESCVVIFFIYHLKKTLGICDISFENESQICRVLFN